MSVENDFWSSPPQWHSLTSQQTLDVLASQQNGLSEHDAHQRLHQFGLNSLPEPKRRGILQRFFIQCHNILIYVLLCSAVVALLLQHWLDSAVILGVVVINALIGLIQEGKAENAILALKSLLSSQASVMRAGVRYQIPSEQLVPGDIVFLQAGDKVPADLRLIHVKNLYVQEAALTGESVAVEKNTCQLAAETVLADQTCMAFSSTLVTYGQATGIVVATATQTEIGRISTLLTQVSQLTTPLLIQLTKFGQQLTVVIVAVSIITLLLGVWLYDFAWSDMFIAVVGLAVAAIPEGLPAIVTITLAIGVQKMAARHAIIRRLPAVETLGEITVICSDKTGTLTRNEMTVTQLVSAAAGEFSLSGQGYDPHGGFEQHQISVNAEESIVLQEISRAVMLCNESHLVNKDDVWLVEGDPTEGALLTMAMKAGLDADEQQHLWPKLDIIPFESQHQFMASLHHDHQGHHVCYVKGAPEKILAMCDSQRSTEQQHSLDFSYWHQQLARLAQQGLRVLAVAQKPMSKEHVDLSFSDMQSGFTLLGLIGMMDPPRDEAVKALKQCESAGISVKMITGDHSVTAAAVARQLGMQQDLQIIDGKTLDSIDDVGLRRLVQQAHVFARATPEHKLRLVEALQANGHIVAMTGDGVNDAPALKRADVGAAMGINGTEVAKDAAEMVLADDNFASIVVAVEEGRTVYDNLKKAILFLLPTSTGEALVIMAAILLGMVMPITPVQILWVNMITAVTLGLALAFEPAEKDLMHRQPRRSDQSLLTPALLWRIIMVGFILMLGSFGLFSWEMQHGSEINYARTVAVNTLVMFEIFYLFNSRYITASVINLRGLLGNPYVLIAVGVLLLFQMAYTYLPVMQLLFGSEALTVDSWWRVILVSSSVFWLVEFEKWCVRRWYKQKSRTT